MQRVEGARTPYEVYCHHCHVTFPAEARRCLHCGGPLSPPGQGPSLGISQAIAVGGPAPPIPADEEQQEGAALMMRRFGGLAMWAIVALSAVLSNLCAE